jgi:hypothetical protein
MPVQQPKWIYLPAPAVKGLEVIENLLRARAVDTSEWDGDGIEVIAHTGQLWWYRGEYDGVNEYQLNAFGICLPYTP